MATLETYRGTCHCGAVRFRFGCARITSGIRCNCSMCIRKGCVMSSTYVAPDDFELLAGSDALAVYQFGDRDLRHYFCKSCGISPFSEVERVPATYDGPAKPGYRRVNLGCVDGLDALALEIALVDGRSF